MNVARDDGASAVEYGLLVAGVAAVLVTGVTVLGGMVRAELAHTAACYTQGQAGFTPPTLADGSPDPAWIPEACGQTPPPTPPPDPGGGMQSGPDPFPAG